MSSESSVSDDDDVALDRLHLSPSLPPPPPPPLCALRAHGGDVQACVLSPCGSFLYSGDSQGDLRIWDVDDRRTVFTEKLHPAEGGILGLFLCSCSSSSSSTRKELLSQGREGTLKLWRLNESGREIVDGGAEESSGTAAPPSSSPPRPLMTTATGSKGFCVLSAVEAQGRLFAAVSSEDAASVRVFDARRGELLCELSEAEAAAAASGSAGGGGTTTGAAPAEEREGKDKAPSSRGMAMAVSLFFIGSSEALHALVGYEDGSVVLWTCLEGAKGGGKKSTGGDDDDGNGARTTTTAAAASLPPPPPPRALSSLRIHFDAVTAVGTSSQNSAGKSSPLRFFSGGADSVLASYLVEEISTSSPPSSSPSAHPSLSLSPGPAAKLPTRGVGALAVLRKSGGADETLVVAGGWDGTIRLLALRGGEESEEEENEENALSLEPVGELENHVAPIAALTLNALGELLASGGRDGSVALWGLEALM